MAPDFKQKLFLALKIWLAIYPAITLVLWLLGSYLAPLPLYLRTMVLTLILVPSMVFALLPLVNRIFGVFAKK